MTYYWKQWLEFIFASDNQFPTIKNCLSFQKYAVSEGIVLHVVYYCEFLLECAKKSGGSVWILGSLIVPLIKIEVNRKYIKVFET